MIFHESKNCEEHLFITKPFLICQKRILKAAQKWLRLRVFGLWSIFWCQGLFAVSQVVPPLKGCSRDLRVRTGATAFTCLPGGSNSRRASASDILAWAEQPYLIPLCSGNQSHLAPVPIHYQHSDPVDLDLAPHYRVYIHCVPLHHLHQFLGLRSSMKIAFPVHL